jgi:hypothetical protein
MRESRKKRNADATRIGREGVRTRPIPAEDPRGAAEYSTAFVQSVQGISPRLFISCFPSHYLQSSQKTLKLSSNPSIWRDYLSLMDLEFAMTRYVYLK